MSTMLKVLVGGIVGGLIGYFTSGLILYKLEEMELEKSVEDTIENLTREELDLIDEKMSKIEEEGQEEIEEARKLINYARYADGKKKSILEQYETSIAKEEVKDANTLSLISEEDFITGKYITGKETVFYYDLDDKLTRADESLVEKPEDLLGSEALVRFGYEKDPDVVYVWNPEREMAFEVIRLHKSYEEEILGIRPEPTKKKVVKKNEKNTLEESE